MRAEALAARGEHAAAIEFARAAVEIAAATDDLLDHADARQALAVALRAAGRSAEADAEEQRAIELWEAKGATLLAERARAPRRGAAPRRFDLAGPAAALPETTLRRVRANAATRSYERFAALLTARDGDALAQILDGSLRVVHHPTWRRVRAARDARDLAPCAQGPPPGLPHEPLASLGDALTLDRHLASFDGLPVTGWTSSEPWRSTRSRCSRRTTRERFVLSEIFAVDHLGDAIARLYERYAELLPDGPERTRAAATARSVAAMLGIARRSIATPRRSRPPSSSSTTGPLGFGSARGAEAYLRGVRTLLELSADIACASTTSSACDPTRSWCAGRTSVPTAPAAAPSSGSSSCSGSSAPTAS